MIRMVLMLISLLCSPLLVYAATGSVTIDSPQQNIKISPTAGGFTLTASYIMTEDSTPTGEKQVPSCVRAGNPSGWAKFSPSYWDTTGWSGTHAELRYRIDGVAASYTPIGIVGFSRGINGRSDLGVAKTVTRFIKTSGMKVGTSHQVTLYMTDIYGKNCKSGFWYWSYRQGYYRGANFASTTLNFTIADPKPSVSISLNKPTLTGCEPETGTITVTSNDPTPNGGTVILTLPDGNTASAPFTGKTATLTFADFGLPNGYTGTQQPGNIPTFKADVTTTAGHTNTASAQALVSNYTASISVNSPSANGLISGLLTVNPIVGCILTGNATIIFHGQIVSININGAGVYPFSFSTQGLVVGNYDVTAAVTINGQTVNVASVPIAIALSTPPISTPPPGGGGNCRLTVTVSPDGGVLEPKLQARDPLPNQVVSARTQAVTITVKDSAQKPIVGAMVTAVVERVAKTETFGGHAHGASNSTRPLGSSSAPKDLGNGTYTTTYSSPIYAAKDQIRIKASFQGCSAEVISQPFISQVSNLFPIATATAPDTLVGGTCNHHGPSDATPAIALACEASDDNHYLTQTSLNKLRRLEQAWIAKYPNSGGLRLNDASLSQGGKFDLYTLWGSDWVSHITHRRGIDIDIGTRDTDGVYSVTKTKLMLLNEDSKGALFRDIKDEADNFHMHVYFE